MIEVHLEPRSNTHDAHAKDFFLQLDQQASQSTPALKGDRPSQLEKLHEARNQVAAVRLEFRTMALIAHSKCPVETSRAVAQAHATWSRKYKLRPSEHVDARVLRMQEELDAKAAEMKDDKPNGADAD